jgi:hypothetical protein
LFFCDGGVNLDFVAGTKEVLTEQPPARNLSAAIKMLPQSTNVAQMPPFWSGLHLYMGGRGVTQMPQLTSKHKINDIFISNSFVP